MQYMRNVMKMFTQPSKEKVRDWLKHRRIKNDTPPDIELIRLELGWRSVDPAVAADKPALTEVRGLSNLA